MLDHQRLRVYHRALDLLEHVDSILEQAKCRAHLKDQLDRAATSVVLNIAEGAGEYGAMEKRRFYRMARRSACETSAILEILRRRAAATSEALDRADAEVAIIVGTLVNLIKKAGQTDLETKTGQGHAQGHGQV